MKASLPSTTRLELRIVHAPADIFVQGEVIKLRHNQDAGCLVLVTAIGNTITSEDIIAVTCDVRTFMSLVVFARADGGITLHRDIA